MEDLVGAYARSIAAASAAACAITTERSRRSSGACCPRAPHGSCATSSKRIRGPAMRPARSIPARVRASPGKPARATVFAMRGRSARRARYTVAVWIGRPDGTPLPGQYGAVTALPLMFQIVDSLPRAASVGDARAAAGERHRGRSLLAARARLRSCAPRSVPSKAARHGCSTASCRRRCPNATRRAWSAGVTHVRIDAKSGRAAQRRMRARDRSPRTDIARWPALAYPWLSRDLRRRASLPPLAAGCAPDGLDATQPIRIDGIADHAAIARAPNSEKPAIVRLRALGASGDVLWLVNGKLEGQTRGGGAFEYSFADAAIRRSRRWRSRATTRNCRCGFCANCRFRRCARPHARRSRRKPGSHLPSHTIKSGPRFRWDDRRVTYALRPDRIKAAP